MIKAANFKLTEIIMREKNWLNYCNCDMTVELKLCDDMQMNN